MRFERVDSLPVNHIEAAAIETDLYDAFRKPVNVEENGSGFDIDIKKYNLVADSVIDILQRDGKYMAMR